jgi:hypothetical protein
MSVPGSGFTVQGFGIGDVQLTVRNAKPELGTLNPELLPLRQRRPRLLRRRPVGDIQLTHDRSRLVQYFLRQLN